MAGSDAAKSRRAQGTGSIVKRGNSYSVVIDLGRGPDGKRKRDWHSGFRTKKAAEKRLTELLAQLDRGEYASPDKSTLAEYLGRWLTYKARQVEPETVERYRELLDAYVIPRIGTVPVQKLRPLHLVDLFDQLARGGRKDGTGLSPRTQLHVFRALFGALKQAKRWGVVAVNVAESIDPPSVPETSVPALSREQAERLLDAAEGIMRIVVMLALATGMRRGELCALRWRNVDLEAGIIRVAEAVRSTAKVGTRIKAPKTSTGMRLIELHPRAVAELRRHHTEQLRTRLLVGPGYDVEADLVIAKADGSAYNPDSLTNYFRVLARKVGLPKEISLHGLRHAHASFLAAEGTSASDIAAVLGHADRGALAQRVYIRPLGDAPARAAQRLGKAMGWGSE